MCEFQREEKPDPCSGSVEYLDNSWDGIFHYYDLISRIRRSDRANIPMTNVKHRIILNSHLNIAYSGTNSIFTRGKISVNKIKVRLRGYVLKKRIPREEKKPERLPFFIQVRVPVSDTSDLYLNKEIFFGSVSGESQLSEMFFLACSVP